MHSQLNAQSCRNEKQEERLLLKMHMLRLRFTIVNT